MALQNSRETAGLVPVHRTWYVPQRDADKPPILECINLGISFGGLSAVENFDLTLGPTEIAGLIGPNGAGKTTIFNLLTKVYQPTHGTILLDGKDIGAMNTAQVNHAGIARTFQNIRLFSNMTVEQNITTAMDREIPYTLFSGIVHGPRYRRAEKEAREKAREYLTIFGMEEYAAARAGIAVLNFGRIIAKGSPEQIQQDPAVIEAYLGRKDA